MKSPFDPEFQNKNLDAKIIAGFERISEVFRVLLWEKGKQIKLSPIQIQILTFLKFHDTNLCTVNNLAIEFNMTPATISDAVSSLVRKKLIKKIQNENDKRFTFLKLTSTGEKYIQNAGTFVDILYDSLKELNSEEKEYLLFALLKIIDKLNQQNILITRRICFTCTYFQRKDGGFYCKFLEMKLDIKDLRIDCPEHQFIEKE